MYEKQETLASLPIGHQARVVHVGGDGALRQHLLDMGMIPGAQVKAIKLAPMGDPLEVTVQGYELTLRIADAKLIEVEECAFKEETQPRKLIDDPSGLHPGLGEEGKYHDKLHETPLPDGVTLTFALAGNQNSGKTTLFNQLTGANQHVGNFPGVTVDRKDGVIRGHRDTLVTDLPGIYSISPYTNEEIVTREFILNEKPKGLINIVDATNIERNLLLTMQLIELDVPMVVALNMMDEVRSNGGTVLINRLENQLGVPVVPISAAKNEGIDELVDHLLHVAKYQEKPRRQDFCDENEDGGAVHRAIHAVMHLIGDKAAKAGIPLRFAASKLIEGDHLVEAKLQLDDGEKDIIEHIVRQMEKERGLDRAAAIADMRFDFIRHLTADTVVKPHESTGHYRSRQADRLLTGKYTAIPFFVIVMAAVFYLTFNVIGAAMQEGLQALIDIAAESSGAALEAAGVSPVLHSLVQDAIFDGVGTVVSFLPIVILMFLFLSIMEDSGYIARVAFFMDKLLRKIGLSGRSIVPMLIGFGCSVPAVMATRTLPSSRDRKMTVFMIPFMSCSAKIMVYGFITAAFFPGRGGAIMTGLYFLAILIGVLVALLMKHTVFQGEAVPFVMELPNYRLPSLKSVGLLVWQKTKDFISKAFTIIFVATIIIWFLRSFDFGLNLVDDASVSIIAQIAQVITPVFAPLGVTDWRIVTGLIAGLMAKENVVATLSMLLGGASIIDVVSPVGAAALLVFVLLYTPCIATVSMIYREFGIRDTAFVVVFQMLVAWIAAFVVHLLLTI